MRSIFVSIAKYRDPELLATVTNIIETCSIDNRLTIHILSQCDDDERMPLPVDSTDGRIRIEQRFVHPSASHGACWARSEIQKYYAGEDYYFQLDSHMQLMPDWDGLLIKDLAALPTDSTVLTAYLCAPQWQDGKAVPAFERPTHFKVVQSSWMPTAKCVLGYPHPRPVRAAFFSGHFAFAPGSFVQDVPYDPELFFKGEEITMAIRAYCAGYDLFTPTCFLGTHNYARIDQKRQRRRMFWDKPDERTRAVKWDDRDRPARKKSAKFAAASWRDVTALAMLTDTGPLPSI